MTRRDGIPQVMRYRKRLREDKTRRRDGAMKASTLSSFTFRPTPSRQLLIIRKP